VAWGERTFALGDARLSGDTLSYICVPQAAGHMHSHLVLLKLKVDWFPKGACAGSVFGLCRNMALLQETLILL
jgi:hypothetical protein